MRVLVIQYFGDYRKVFKYFSEGHDETYYGQKYSINAVAEIGKKADDVATLCCRTKEPYDERLENGVRAIGTGFVDKIPTQKLLKLVQDYKPTHLIFRTPNRDLIRWAIKNNLKILMLLADSFNTQGLRGKIRNSQLANLLNHRQIEWVGNHNITASISLANIGVNPDKIIPWDWPYQINPDSFPAKSLSPHQKTWNIFYVGAVREDKGVGDVIEAIAHLKKQGISVKMTAAGKGEIEHFKSQAKSLHIEDAVEFLGLVPNKTVIPRMREADCVVVPSRSEYPEGFPKSINEGLCSRTPIIASDHPMFVRKLSHRNNALLFPASHPIALAECIQELISSPKLYQSLSSASSETWKNLQIPVKWANLIDHWLFTSPEHQQWLFKNRLSSGQYPEF